MQPAHTQPDDGRMDSEDWRAAVDTAETIGMGVFQESGDWDEQEVKSLIVSDLPFGVDLEEDPEAFVESEIDELYRIAHESYLEVLREGAEI